MDVSETKNMDLFNKVHIFETIKSHIYEPNISLIDVCIDIYVMMSSDLYGTCRHCLYGTLSHMVQCRGNCNPNYNCGIYLVMWQLSHHNYCCIMQDIALDANGQWIKCVHVTFGKYPNLGTSENFWTLEKFWKNFFVNVWQKILSEFVFFIECFFWQFFSKIFHCFQDQITLY